MAPSRCDRLSRNAKTRKGTVSQYDYEVFDGFELGVLAADLRGRAWIRADAKAVLALTRELPRYYLGSEEYGKGQR
jgi:hypothetical protein